MLFCCLATSVPTRAAGSVTPAPALSTTTSQSSIEGPPSTLGILPWILHFGASFHMTPDRTRISFICPPPSAHCSNC